MKGKVLSIFPSIHHMRIVVNDGEVMEGKFWDVLSMAGKHLKGNVCIVYDNVLHQRVNTQPIVQEVKALVSYELLKFKEIASVNERSIFDVDRKVKMIASNEKDIGETVAAVKLMVMLLDLRGIPYVLSSMIDDNELNSITFEDITERYSRKTINETKKMLCLK